MRSAQAFSQSVAAVFGIAAVVALLMIGATHVYSRVPGVVADAVASVCDVPPALRDKVRGEIEKAVAPNRVTVSCADE